VISPSWGASSARRWAAPAIAGISIAALAQNKPVPPTASRPSIDKGEIEGSTYKNRTLHFSVTFPESWFVAGDEFEEEMKKKGFDLGLKAPAGLAPSTRNALDRSLLNVTLLATAYRSKPGTTDNAIVRITAEDLSRQPAIKDAVDYCDAVRASYGSIRLPADFRFSETQAEQLGPRQFACLDTYSKSGKKRMYVTVRDRRAILFTLTYRLATDLETLRKALSTADFRFK
jgi:hypothetical protein